MATATTPVSFSSTKENTNYARLCRLLVDVGSYVLRDKFDSILPSKNLYRDLHDNTSCHTTSTAKEEGYKSNTMGKPLPSNVHLSIIKKL